MLLLCGPVRVLAEAASGARADQQVPAATPPADLRSIRKGVSTARPAAQRPAMMVQNVPEMDRRR